MWVAVYLTDDGPVTVGPFAHDADAQHHIIERNIELFGDDPTTGRERLDRGEKQWTARVIDPANARELAL